MWIVLAIGVAVLALAHTAPAPFLFDAISGGRAVWHMPKQTPPTIYLTFDDGPNPTTTPDLLDVLAREQVRATFFLIDRHISEATAPLVRRIFDEGHAVALHSATRAYMLMSATTFARTLGEAADHIERLTGQRPCAAFRPHAGWRSWQMYAGLKQIAERNDVTMFMALLAVFETLLHRYTHQDDLIVGSLQTWRQIPDWLDSASLPEWVVQGVSA